MASATQLLLDALRLQPTAEADEFALHSGGGSLSERALTVFLNAQDAEGQTALHVACRDGHTALASVMLAAGADPGVCDLELNTAVSAAVRPSISIDNKQLDSKRLENRNVLGLFLSLSSPLLSFPRTRRLETRGTKHSGCSHSTQRRCRVEGECGRLLRCEIAPTD